MYEAAAHPDGWLSQILIILIYTRLRRSEIERNMYVCICNCVTDRQLIEAAVECAGTSDAAHSRRFAERIADQLGAGLGCGTCREFAVELVERTTANQESVVLPERTSSLAIDSLMTLEGELPYQTRSHPAGSAPSQQGE